MLLKKISFLATILFLLVNHTVYSQEIDSLINDFGLRFPQERVHVQTDKQMYLPGETMWFKIYLQSNGLPSFISTNAYADLVDTKGNILKKITMPVVNGTADGSVVLPDSISTNTLLLRVYTAWMLNFKDDYMYYQPVALYRSGNNAVSNQTSVARVSFFPEGGHLTAGVANQVAFTSEISSAAYDNPLVIKDKEGNVIDSISLKDGRGVFTLLAEEGKAYFAEGKNGNGELMQMPLPPVLTDAVSLHTDEIKGFVYYTLQTPMAAPDFKNLSVIAYINQQVTYKAIVDLNDINVNSGRIPLTNLPAGMLHIVVVNNKKQLLASRDVIVNRNTGLIPITVDVVEKGLGKREKNTLKIHVPDTLATYLSLSVYDNNLWEETGQKDIESDFLFDGKMSLPDSIITNNQIVSSIGLINTFDSFGWQNLLLGKEPVMHYKDSVYLSATGSIVQTKPGTAVTLIISPHDAEKQWYFINTDDKGNFNQNGLVFFDTATVFYKPNQSLGKGQTITVSESNGLLTENILFAPIPPFPETHHVRNSQVQASGIELYQKLVPNDTEHILKGVVVTARKKALQKIQELDTRYATGYFKGLNGFQLDLITDSLAYRWGSVFDYMVAKLPCLKVLRNGISQYLTYTCDIGYDPKASPDAILYYINESQADYNTINNLALQQIAYIKLIKLPLRGFPWGVSVYLKKDSDYKQDLRSLPGNLKQKKMAGYTPVKDWVLPNYSKNNNSVAPDLRTTLYWQPYLTTDKDNQTTIVSFYNNDVCKSYRIVLEGMDEEGKLIHVEKVVK